MEMDYKTECLNEPEGKMFYTIVTRFDSQGSLVDHMSSKEHSA